MNNCQDFIIYCQQHKIRLTTFRKMLIELLLQYKKPLTAYEILGEMKKNHPNANIMSIYRNLEFFRQHKLIHKLDSSNRFSLCCHPSDSLCQIFICQRCGAKVESHNTALSQMIHSLATDTGFELKQNKIELSGICRRCSADAVSNG
ncbi:MAG: Fur family transcriptional regulator [Francisellaceae bacterium]